MARIRLQVVNTPATMQDAQGREFTAESLRVHCLFRAGAEGRELLREGLIDTAASLCVFPELQWRLFEADIDWQTDRIISRQTRVSGGAYPFRIGRVRLEVTQPDLSVRLTPVICLAQFLEGDQLGHILLGVGGGFLHQRRLVLEPDLCEAWLEEVTPPGGGSKPGPG